MLPRLPAVGHGANDGVPSSTHPLADFLLRDESGLLGAVGQSAGLMLGLLPTGEGQLCLPQLVEVPRRRNLMSSKVRSG